MDWIWEKVFGYLPNDLEPFLLLSIIIALLYFVSLNYTTKHKKAPPFISWIKILILSILIFFVFLWDHLIFVMYLPLLSLPSNSIPWPSFLLFFMCLGAIYFPSYAILFPKANSKRQTADSGLAIGIFALILPVFLTAGNLGGSILRTVLDITPYYSKYMFVHIFCFLSSVGIAGIYLKLLGEAQRRRIGEEYIKCNLGIKHVVLALAFLVISSSLLYCFFIFNEYTVSETTVSTYSIDDLGKNGWNSSITKERELEVSWVKRGSGDTPFEEDCSGVFSKNGKYYNGTYFITPDTENCTVLCQESMESAEVGMFWEPCQKEENQTVCKFGVNSTLSPIDLDDTRTLWNFGLNYAPCQNLTVYGTWNGEPVKPIGPQTIDVENKEVLIDFEPKGTNGSDLTLMYYVNYSEDSYELLKLVDFNFYEPTEVEVTIICHHYPVQT